MIKTGPGALQQATASDENAGGASVRALEELRAHWIRLRKQGRQLAATLGARWAERSAASLHSLVRPRILRQAISAARRGNLDAAFALLREEVSERPDDPKSTLLFWGVALASERAPEAAEPMARLVRRQAALGDLEAAADQWLALATEVPGAVLDVATLARIVPVLRARYSQARGEAAQQQARERLLDALRRSVDPASGVLTPGIALRLVEEARGLDADVARRAAEAALAAPGLHEAKRARLSELVRSLADGRWPEAPLPPPSPPARPTARALRVTPPATNPAAIAIAVPTPPAPRPESSASAASAELPRSAPRVAPMPPAAASSALRVVEIIPVELTDDGLVAWEVANEQRTRVHYRAIEAVAAAEVLGLAETGVIVIDLILRSTRPGRPRSSLRMRSNAFDPAALFPERTDAGQALRALLSEVLDRSGATPLPSPDSALALRPQRFESLAAFQTETLARLPGGHPRETRRSGRP